MRIANPQVVRGGDGCCGRIKRFEVVRRVCFRWVCLVGQKLVDFDSFITHEPWIK